MNLSKIETECILKTSRSGGKGGQNVNKVETKVTLKFSIQKSSAFTDEQKEILLQKLANRISKNGYLILICNDTRTQLENKQIALKRLIQVLESALTKRKLRIATKISKEKIQQRLTQKRMHSEIKKLRSHKNFRD